MSAPGLMLEIDWEANTVGFHAKKPAGRHLDRLSAMSAMLAEGATGRVAAASIVCSARSDLCIARQIDVAVEAAAKVLRGQLRALLLQEHATCEVFSEDEAPVPTLRLVK